jgi:hypothetical protein
VIFWSFSFGAGALIDDGTETALIAAGVLLFTAGLLGVRHRVAGHGPGLLFMVVAAVAITAHVIGSTIRISGVLLSVPVLAGMALVLWRSDWRLGDLALMTTISGLGAGAAYLIVALVDPDTGSFGDQGAVVLIGLGLVMSLLTLVLTTSLPRAARALIPAGVATLVLGAVLMAAIGSGVGLILTVPGAVAMAVALVWIGMTLTNARAGDELRYVERRSRSRARGARRGRSVDKDGQATGAAGARRPSPHGDGTSRPRPEKMNR